MVASALWNSNTLADKCCWSHSDGIWCKNPPRLCLEHVWEVDANTLEFLKPWWQMCQVRKFNHLGPKCSSWKQVESSQVTLQRLMAEQVITATVWLRLHLMHLSYSQSSPATWASSGLHDPLHHLPSANVRCMKCDDCQDRKQIPQMRMFKDVKEPNPEWKDCFGSLCQHGCQLWFDHHPSNPWWEAQMLPTSGCAP